MLRASANAICGSAYHSHQVSMLFGVVEVLVLYFRMCFFALALQMLQNVGAWTSKSGFVGLWIVVKEWVEVEDGQGRV